MDGTDTTTEDENKNKPYIILMDDAEGEQTQHLATLSNEVSTNIIEVAYIKKLREPWVELKEVISHHFNGLASPPLGMAEITWYRPNEHSRCQLFVVVKEIFESPCNIILRVDGDRQMPHQTADSDNEVLIITGKSPSKEKSKKQKEEDEKDDRKNAAEKVGAMRRALKKVQGTSNASNDKDKGNTTASDSTA